LPVFDRNQGNILAAERAISKAATEQRAAEVGAHAGLRTAYEGLRAAFEQASALRDHVIPDAQRTYEGARDAYSRGLFRYLEVLDAQRSLFELRSQYLDALARYHQASADLARLTGGSPDGPPADQGRDDR